MGCYGAAVVSFFREIIVKSRRPLIPIGLSKKMTKLRSFTPISMDDYIAKHLAANPSDDRAEVVANLANALAAFKAGATCSCGEPIWVLGSAFAGHACFTCISGESDSSRDFEIAEACHGEGTK
jgi:hypothetical protein